ncbi:MAG: hypothetical protein KAU24_03830 [Candidatus Aenigmarchaeota archaeon]|nr:hypothetical protein [Candidatus Aenigmarchaeota archaeon]
METFERSLLEFLLKVYDSHIFVKHEVSENEKSGVEEMRKAIFKPHVMKCYVSDGRCCYSLSPHHLKKCVGFDDCIIAIMKKRKERGIEFK